MLTRSPSGHKPVMAVKSNNVECIMPYEKWKLLVVVLQKNKEASIKGISSFKGWRESWINEEFKVLST